MQKGILLQDLSTLQTLNVKPGTVNNAIIQLGDIDDSGKGRKFVSKFIQPGLVKIEGHGIVLLRKETLDESLPTIVGSPVIIQHKDVTEENADELRCGVIANAYFNQPDGWYYVDGIIWDDKAQDLINKGWSVSCSYDYLAFNDEGGEENNIHYDKEFTQLNFTHLAIVDNPRYERANIVFNSKDEEKGEWVTIKGNHIFIPDGKTLDEVIKEKGWGSKENKQSDTKDKQSYNKAKGRAQKALDLAKKTVEGNELSKQEKDWLNSNKSADELSKDKQSGTKDVDAKIQEALGNAISEFYSDDVDVSAKTLKELKELSGRDISKDEVIEIARQVTIDHDWDKAIERLKGSKEDRDADAFRKNREQERKNKFKGDKVKAFLNEEYDGGNVTADRNKMKKLANLLGVDFWDLDDDRIQDIFEYSSEDYQYFYSHTDEENRDYDIERTTDKLKKYAKELNQNKEGARQNLLKQDLKSMLKKISPSADYRYDADEKELQVRYLGKWEGDDGSGDYDWQTPTQDTKDKIEEIKKEFKKRFGYDLKSSWGEKNWYSFWIPDNKTNNSKEQDKMILNALKSLITVVENAKDGDENGKWVTIKGNHIFIPDGKTLDEVIKEKGWGSKENKQSDSEGKHGFKKDKDSGYYMKDLSDGTSVYVEKKEGGQGEKEPFYLEATHFDKDGQTIAQKQYHYDSMDGMFDKIDKDFVSKEKQSETSGKPNIDKMSFDNKINGDGPILVKGEKRCETYKDTYKYILERTEKIFENAKKERSPIQSFEAGLRNLNGNYAIRDVLRDKQEQYHKITQQITEYQNSLKEQLKDNKTNNSKEQDMAIIEELKKLIFKVENNKENETMVENEKVDKRKLIDEVAGIMKSAGCDDEDIRTAIGKMEKIGYDDSEASADNKKVKNEADEEDKKVDNEEDEKEEDKKVDNEDEEDKEKTEDLKEEEKKDVENKCKNSVENAKGKEFFDKINKIYNSAKKIEEPSVDYESKQARLEAGKEYFG